MDPSFLEALPAIDFICVKSCLACSGSSAPQQCQTTMTT